MDTANVSEQDKTTNQPRRKRKLYKWLIIFSILIILVLIVVYIFSRLNQPVTAGVKATQGQASSSYYSVDLTPTPVAGPYSGFNYPKGLHLISTALVGPNSVEDFNFYVKDLYSWTLAIDIDRTPTGLLTQTTSYTLRKNNPETYSESLMIFNNQSVDVMTDTTVVGGFSKVAYLSHGNLVATVSLIGNDSSGIQPLQTTFAMVLDSWRWL